METGYLGMNCPYCLNYDVGANFCSNCGKLLRRGCKTRDCDARLDIGMNFCRKCGQKA